MDRTYFVGSGPRLVIEDQLGFRSSSNFCAALTSGEPCHCSDGRALLSYTYRIHSNVLLLANSAKSKVNVFGNPISQRP